MECLLGVLGVVDEFFEDLEVAMVRIEGGLFLSKLSLDFRDSSNLLLRLSFNKVSLIRALLFDIVAENFLKPLGYQNLRKLLIPLPHRAPLRILHYNMRHPVPNWIN